MARRPLVIVNPASRGGAGARDWPRAASALRAHFGAFDCRFTERAGEAFEIAREASTRGRSILLTFGGDGTISETARGILDSGRPSALGILPHGTGGDLARSLSLPKRLADVARGLRRSRTVAIDVGRAVFADGQERTFLNSASFGLSAEVAGRINRDRPKGSGVAAYARHTLEAALDFSHPAVRIRVDAKPERCLPITTVSLLNGRFFGGGMEMAPGASLVDGALDVVVVKKLPVAELLARAPLLYWGAHLHLEAVEHGTLARLEASPAEPGVRVPVEIDGETGFALPARFELRPRALRLLLPA